MDLRAFIDELEKIAKPAWVKRLMGLSPEAQERLISSASKLREVKSLGHGGERIADLVVHPKHGLSVRKVPLLKSQSPEHIKNVEEFSALQRGMEGRLKEISGGKGPFAHILGEGPKGEAYYQFAKGAPADTALVKAFEKAKAAKERARKVQTQAYRRYRSAKDIGSPDAEKLKQRWVTLRDEMNATSGPLSDARLQLSSTMKDLPPGAKNILEKLKLEYPGLHDLRPSNVVGGKIVDISPQVGHSIMKAPYPKSPLAFSKQRAFK